MIEHKPHMTRGGNGSHWQGCEETHWDCKIAHLERENERLRSIIEGLRLQVYLAILLLDDKELLKHD